MRALIADLGQTPVLTTGLSEKRVEQSTPLIREGLLTRCGHLPEINASHALAPAVKHGDRGRGAQPIASAQRTHWRSGPAHSRPPPVPPGHLLDGESSPHADCPGVGEGGRGTTMKRRALPVASRGPRVGWGQWPRSPPQRLAPGWPSPPRLPDAPLQAMQATTSAPKRFVEPTPKAQRTQERTQHVR